MDFKGIINNIKDDKKKLIIVIVVALILIIAIIGAIVIGSMGGALDKGNTDTVSVTIESGSGTSQIAQTLVDHGIIDSADQFKLWSRIKGYDSDYKAGTYALSPSMDFDTIGEIIIGGKISTLNFTIPEGYTIYQVADSLAADGLVDRDRFVQLLEEGQWDYDFLDGAQNNKNHLEGYLFPNTYTVGEGATEEDYISVMLDQFGKEITDEHYKKAKKLGMTMNDIVIIASIIERECKVDDERPLVASVIYNRLEEGMSLQMCSTVQYVLGKQKEVLTYADTRIESPYNTYINPGLPPGPICSPGLAAIEAALNPANTDYLYFVLSEKLDGTSNFSSDYEKFQRDSQAYNDAYEAAN